MKKKAASALAAFGEKKSAGKSAPLVVERERGKHEVVALTVRVPRASWRRLHELGLSEGVSLQTLLVRGLNRVFTEKGLPKLINE